MATLEVVREYVSLLYDVVNSLDIDYLQWVLWVVNPIFLSFVLPIVILILLYITALILYIYELRMTLRNAYSNDIWDGARKTAAALWRAQARIWHGYEVEGLENIPSSGPALIIYYHGTIPVDFYYVLTECLLQRGRQIHAVGDKFLFHIPGWKRMMQVFNVTPGTVRNCVETLKNGHILAIAPGGVREALFGDENYSLMWGRRTGFAKVALQSNVPIIPMFTKNCREAFRTPGWARAWLRGIYERTRIPIVPIYGLFPVKLKTFFGEPIHPSNDSTPEELAELVKSRIENLIEQYQKRPGSIFRSVLERIPIYRRLFP